MPEVEEAQRESLARSFRGQRGRVLLRESVTVTAAGGPAPMVDWKPSSLSPDLQKAMSTETMEAARAAIFHAFGVLPALASAAATGPIIREAQRHLATWTLPPIAAQIDAEASKNLGSVVALDIMTPLQAFDAGGRARALKGVVDAMAAAKAAGLSGEQMAAAAAF